MILLKCDRCDRVLEAPDDLAGRKIECPACGDVNLVPAALAAPAQPGALSAIPAASPAKPATPDRAAAAGYPPAAGPEQPVMTLHPVTFRSRPFVTLIVLAALLVGAAGGVYFSLIAAQRDAVLASIASLLFIAAVLVILVWKVAARTERLEITSKRTVERKGLLSRATTEVLHSDIRNVQVTQTLGQRILRTGSLGLSSAAQDDVEIIMHNLPNPQGVKRVVDLYRPL
ncbi:MAG: PH domain-containing protein [Phycisphaerales bacterium]|nr:PH domain-containing protein [Phycisphaerales bacterium]